MQIFQKASFTHLPMLERVSESGNKINIKTFLIRDKCHARKYLNVWVCSYHLLQLAAATLGERPPMLPDRVVAIAGKFLNVGKLLSLYPH
jgi:hypothetical protein